MSELARRLALVPTDQAVETLAGQGSLDGTNPSFDPPGFGLGHGRLLLGQSILRT